MRLRGEQRKLRGGKKIPDKRTVNSQDAGEQKRERRAPTANHPVVIVSNQLEAAEGINNSSRQRNAHPGVKVFPSPKSLFQGSVCACLVSEGASVCVRDGKGKRRQEGRTENGPLDREPHGLGGELRKSRGRKRSQAPLGLKTEDVTLRRAGEWLSLLEFCKNTLFICSAVEIQSDLPLLAQEE